MSFFFSFFFSGLGLFMIISGLIWACHSSLNDSLVWVRLGDFRSWSSPFECGCLSSMHSATNFGVTYVSLLVFFVIFDLEVALILNLPFQGSLYYNFVYYLSFLIILTAGYTYELLSGYACWGF